MNSTEAKTIQGVISAGLAAVSCYINALLIPVIILVAVMILDYITGMAVAWNSSGLSSKKGIKGIVKKVLYFVLVAVGMVVDWSIMYWLSMNVFLLQISPNDTKSLPCGRYFFDISLSESQDFFKQIIPTSILMITSSVAVNPA